MQPFCFFVATKEVGVWGLVPTNKKHKKDNRFSLNSVALQIPKNILSNI